MSSRDPYEAVLADLRAKRNEIDALIRTLEAVRAQPKPSILGTPQHRRGGYLFGLSVVDASKVVLRQLGRPLCSADIAKGLMAGGHVMRLPDVASTIVAELDRILQEGDGVVRMRQGTWGLEEWQQGTRVTSTDKVVPFHSDGDRDVLRHALDFRHDC